VILGDLTVQGDTTTINTQVLTVEDKNIQLAFLPNPGDRSDITAEAGGITLMGTTDKTLNWYGQSNAWTSNVNFDLTLGNVYKINNIEVLSYNGVLNFEPTITAFDVGTDITLGATTGTLTLRNPEVVGVNTTQDLYNTVATTVNAFGDATAINIGADTGTLTLRNPEVVGVNTTQDLYNTVAETVNFAGTATAINIGASTGITNIKNNLDVDLDIEVGGDVYPTLDGVSDLGKDDFRFKDLYLSGNTIYLGDSTISSVTETTNVTPHNSIVTNSNVDLNATGYLKVPKGTIEQRPGEPDQPTAEAGQIRFNTTGTYFEGYDGIKWKRLGVDIDQAEQYGSLAPFVMDRYEVELYKTGEYTIQVENALSNHSFKALVTHNGSTSNVTISNEVIVGAEAARISSRILNGFVEVLLTPVYEGTEVQFSKVLLDNDYPVQPAGITAFPVNSLDIFDLQTTNFNIDLELIDDSDIDLEAERIPGYGGIIPLDDDKTVVLDLALTDFSIDLDQSLNTILINNSGLVDEVLQCITVGEPDKLDLSVFYYYIHPALDPVLLESPSTP
jgi:hypothetical protein